MVTSAQLTTTRSGWGRTAVALLLAVATIGLLWGEQAAPAAAAGPAGQITTIAGTVRPGPAPADETGQTPIGVALYPAGSNPTVAYVADVDYSVVRRIDLATGAETVYAGSGATGSGGDGGPATSATLTSPVAVAVDSGGNLFIADRDANRIRRVDGASKVITTVAGTGTGGFNGDGTATSRQLNAPTGLAIDQSGTGLVIADRANNRVRRLAGGQLTTIAGGGTGPDGVAATAAALNNPAAVAVAPSGAVYVADMFNYRIRSFTVGGAISTVVGSGTVSDALTGDRGTPVHFPQGLAVDSGGRLLYADTTAHVVRRVVGNQVETVAGSVVGGKGQAGFSGDGTAAVGAELSSPWGLAVAGTTVYVPDLGNRRLRTFPVGGAIDTVAGTSPTDLASAPATSTQLQRPGAVAVDTNGDVYVADTDNCVVRRLSAGTITTVAGTGSCGNGASSGPATSTALDHPRGVAVSGGVVTVADTGNSSVRQFPTTGGTMTRIAGTGAPALPGTCTNGTATGTALGAPTAVAVVGTDVYVADAAGNCVRRIAVGGAVTRIAGTGQNGYGGDGGAATSARLSAPEGVAVDGSGQVFVADTGNNRIRKVATNGVITTVAGTGAAGSSGDGGPATAATLVAPAGVDVDGSGRLYLADTGNHAVRLVTTGGLIVRVAGSTPGYAGDGGPSTAALLEGPADVTVLASGDMVIADRANNRLRQVTAFTGPSAPRSVAATAGQRSASVTWQPPASDGGAPITGYTVTASPGGSTCTTTTTSCVVYELDPGTPTTFTVRADNDFGSATSSPSGPVSPLDSFGIHPMSPTRILDSRSGNGLNGRWGPGQARTLQVAGRGGLPAAAQISAVVMNVTVTDTTAAGFVSVYPSGGPRPNASNLNFESGDTLANLVTVPLSPDGTVDIYNHLGSTSVVADVVGWYDRGAGGDLFTPLAPARVLDTRSGNGLSGPFAPYSTRDLLVAGRGGVPADATSVVLNVTVTETAGPSFLTVFPAGTTRPDASSLNWAAGDTRANLVTVKLGSGGAAAGRVSIYDHGYATQVVADVVGYYRGGSGLGFYPLAPQRVLDSRDGTGGYTTPWGEYATRPLQITGTASVPSIAQAALLNVTVAGPTKPGFLSLFPAGTTRPDASNLNWRAGQVVPNLAAVKLGSGSSAGRVAIYNHNGQVEVIADLFGWFG